MTRLLTFTLLLLFAHAVQSQDYLGGIQKSLLDARSASFRTGSNQLRIVIAELEAKAGEDWPAITSYWVAFGLYQETIFLLSNNQNEAAYAQLKLAINHLENLKEKDSEIMALLGMFFSLAINFEPNMAVIFSGKADRFFDKARKKDPDNLRAYLGLGRSDFYTPEEYGGGLEVEKYLTKAIAMEDRSANYAYAPDWGKDEAYWYLVQYYYREGHDENAILYCKQGLRKFPDHHGLNELMDKMGSR